jgi:hypothetical protein
MTTFKTARIAIGLLACCSPVTLANHGPGTSGGASATVSGETLRQGHFDLSLREDYTQFQDISRSGAERRALNSGEFDALKRSWLTSASIAYGITDDFQIGLTIGYYAGENFIDAESEDVIGTAKPRPHFL